MLESRQIALYEAEMLHLVVQNAETMGVREGKTRSIRSFMDATVARELMPDCTVRNCADIHIAFSGLADDSLICDFIPVLEITSRL